MNDILIKVGADISDFSRKMAESNQALQNFGNANKQTFDSFKKVGAVATATGTAIGVGLGKAVKTAADFEAGMSEVAAISGVSGKELDILSDKAREMGATTVFSASESAEAMKYMALAGWDTSQMVAGIEPALNLAAASGMDLARTADIVTDGMSMFGMKAEEAGRMTDTLAAASSKTNTDVDQLGEALKYVGANANAAGMDIEQTSAFLGILADNGIKGSMAGTTLNAMLRDLKKNSEDGAVAVGDQTVALYDADGQMRDMTEVVDDLIVATADMSDEQRDAALAAVFGEQALKGFNSIAESGVGSVGKLADELYNSEGAAADMADTMQDNLNGALTELSSAFEGILISLGTALIPVIRKVVEWITMLADWFNNLSESTKTITAVIAAVAAGFMLIVGPLLMLIGFIPQIIAGFAALKTVVAAIGAAFTAISWPIVAVVAAIGAVIAVLVLMYNKVEWFREMVDEAWQAIKDAFSVALNFIKDIFTEILSAVVDFGKQQLDKLREFWDENGADIMGIVKRAFESVRDIIKTVMGIIKGVFEAVWPVITNVVKTAWTLIKGIIDVAINLVLGIIKTVLNLLKGDWKGAWTSIKDTAKNIMDSIVNTFKSIDLLQVGKDIINGLIKGIKSMGSAVKDGVMSLANKLPGWVKEPLGIKSPSRVFMALGRFTGEGLAVGINDMTGEVKKAAERMTDAAMPDERKVDLSYITPSGIKSTLASAVRGTVDVNNRDERLAGAINSLERRLGDLEVVMDGRTVAKVLDPHIRDRQDSRSRNERRWR